VEGNRRTSLRQDVQLELKQRGTACKCVRCREVRKQHVNAEKIELHDLVYPAAQAEEHFISFDTPDDKLAGFIRLSLPSLDAPDTEMSDLAGAALIREVHVYGQSLPVGAEKEGAAQHAGLGTQLLEKAERIARERGFHRVAVISAVGTRKYYLDRGFERGELYLVKNI
jgi:elongator complex protein 3